MFWEDQIFLIHSNDFLLLPWASLGLSLGIQTRITISSQYSDWYLTSNITHIHYSRHALNHCNIPHNYETQTSWTVDRHVNGEYSPSVRIELYNWRGMLLSWSVALGSGFPLHESEDLAGLSYHPWSFEKKRCTLSSYISDDQLLFRRRLLF